VIEELRDAATRLGDTQSLSRLALAEATYHEAASEWREVLRVYRAHVDVLRERHDPDLPVHLGNLAWSSVVLGEYAYAAEILDELEERATTLDQPMNLVYVLVRRGWLALYRGDLHTAQQFLHEALGEARRHDTIHLQTMALLALAQVALAVGEITEAEHWARQLVRAAWRAGWRHAWGEGYTLIARAALLQGRPAVAHEAATKALDNAVDTDHTAMLALVLATVGQIASATGNPTDAATLHAGAETLRTQIGFVHPAPRARELEHEYHQIRDALGTDAFNEAWKTGTSLGNEELVGEARRVLSAVPASPAE
jgi:tetratricopeptide (TPR) repeat protein